MDILLTEPERMLQRQLRDFVQAEIAPCADEWDRRNELAYEAFQKVASVGLTGLTVPEEYGGQGGSLMDALIASIELARASVSVASIVGTHMGLALGGLYRYGNEDQRRRFVVPAAKGERLCSYALTEHDASSDISRMTTTARREGDEWIINGAKCFISNGDRADMVLLFATVDKQLGNKGITAFVVEKGTPGFSVGKIEDKLGIRAESAAELMFDDVHVPMENQIGEVGKGMRIALSILDEGRLDVAGQGVGLASAALDAAVAYSKERQQFGQPICEFQGIQWMLVDMATQVDAAWLLAYRAARLADQGQRFSKEVAQAKLFAANTAMDVARKSLQIHGGYGYMKDLPIERFYRDAKILEIYEGTSEVQKLVIGRAILS
ncbi:MAG: acyl-CoA dehydrogenase family protein [Dehalococcoidia bacterium]|nr:acyl-CoA dehydrogenase family protein [Dehalococcoidia bacterium]